jgi:hypothetical protein
MISYQVSQTNDAISLPFPIKKWKIKSSWKYIVTPI